MSKRAQKPVRNYDGPWVGIPTQVIGTEPAAPCWGFRDAVFHWTEGMDPYLIEASDGAVFIAEDLL